MFTEIETTRIAMLYSTSLRLTPAIAVDAKIQDSNSGSAIIQGTIILISTSMLAQITLRFATLSYVAERSPYLDSKYQFITSPSSRLRLLCYDYFQVQATSIYRLLHRWYYDYNCENGFGLMPTLEKAIRTRMDRNLRCSFNFFALILRLQSYTITQFPFLIDTQHAEVNSIRR